MPNQGGSYVLRDGKRVPRSRPKPAKDPQPEVEATASAPSDGAKHSSTKTPSSVTDKPHKVKEPSNG